MLRVDYAVHHYINFVSIFNVVCVSSLTHRPTPPPLMAKGHRIIVPTQHHHIRKCLPAAPLSPSDTVLCTNRPTLRRPIYIQIYSHPPPSLRCLSYVLRTADNIYRSLLRCAIYYINIRIYSRPPPKLRAGT